MTSSWYADPPAAGVQHAGWCGRPPPPCAVATPPTSISAARRSTDGQPHQKAAPWRSFPRQMTSKKMLCSLRRGSSSRARVAEAAVVEGLRALDHGDLRVGHVAEHPLEQLRPRHVVGVEGDQELGVDVLEGVVDVARLGVRARGRAAEVARAQLVAHLAAPRRGRRRRAPTPRARTSLRMAERADDRRAQHVLVLVEGRDQHRHPAARAGAAAAAARASAPARERQQHEHHEAVGLGERPAAAPSHRAVPSSVKPQRHTR